MLGWIYRIIFGRFGGCEHKWSIIKEQPMTSSYPGGGEKDYIRFTLQCGKCGNVKCKNIQ